MLTEEEDWGLHAWPTGLGARRERTGPAAWLLSGALCGLGDSVSSSLGPTSLPRSLSSGSH